MMACILLINQFISSKRLQILDKTLLFVLEK